MHGVAGFDHVAPAAFLEKMRADLRARYSKVEYKAATIDTARKLENTVFEVVDDKGETYQGKRLVLATGVKDIMEDIPGYEHAWARGM
jgi:thioredoxin reductase